MKIIIGLAGNQGSGKTEASRFISSVTNKKTKIIKVSKVLRDTLRLWNLPIDQENMQKVSDFLKDTFGEGTLSKILEKQIRESEEEIIIIDGIRGMQVFDMIKCYSNSHIIFLQSNKETRFERIIKRNEKFNENNLSENKFNSLESHRTENIPKEIISNSDLIIINEGNIEELQEKIKQFLIEKRII